MAVIFLWPMFLVSCDGKEQSQSPRPERDGLPVVANAVGPRHEGPLFRFEADIVIGGREDGSEWQLFAGLGWLIVGPDGRMYVGNDRNQILILNPRGDLLKTVGGRGQGPGEFDVIGGLYWLEDEKEFWVHDWELCRMTRFTADGGLIDTFSYSGQTGPHVVFAYLGNRKFVGMERENIADGYQIIRFRYLDDRLRSERVLSEFTRRNIFWLSSRIGVGTPIPFLAMPRVVSFPDGRFCVMNPEEATLLIYDDDGEPLCWIDKPWERPGVSSADIENWRQSYMGRGSPGGVFKRGDLDEVPIPERHVPFISALTDDEGRLWLRRARPPRTTVDEGRPPVTMDVFNRAGEWLGFQIFEPGSGIPAVIRDGLAYTVWNDPEREKSPCLIRTRMVPLYPGRH